MWQRSSTIFLWRPKIGQYHVETTVFLCERETQWKDSFNTISKTGNLGLVGYTVECAVMQEGRSERCGGGAYCRGHARATVRWCVDWHRRRRRWEPLQNYNKTPPVQVGMGKKFIKVTTKNIKRERVSSHISFKSQGIDELYWKGPKTIYFLHLLGVSLALLK